MTTPFKTPFRVALSALLVLALSSCAHREPQSESTDPEAPQVTLHEPESFRVTDPQGPKLVDEELEQIPTEINPLVEKWITYFQGRGRPHMERYLARSTRYMQLMKKILKQNGLPEDLVYIALIESGFSSQATSRAAAVGYWQFIRGTGKRYGLQINSLVDERRDPVLSTQAAAEYFKGLYSVFGSWYLAMASYNVGENRVKREVMNHYTRDFWELARKKRFPKETVNYIPKFIAAKMIGNDPAKYGFENIDYLTPIEFEHIKVDQPVNLSVMAKKMGIDYDDLKDLNPKFRGEIAPLKGDVLELRVPLGQIQTALVAAKEAAVSKVEYIADSGDTKIYKVRSGDSLYSIARKFRTTIAWLRDTNDLKKGRKLRIGKRLAVPDRSVAKRSVAKTATKVTKKEDVEKASANPEIITKKGVFYVVQPGDTLSAIADDYSSSVEELRRMNRMSRRSILKAGMKLRVPKDEGLPADPSGAKATRQVAEEKTSDKSNGESSSVEAHVVKPGDNLTTIARRYGVTIRALRKANKLTKRSILKVGVRLVIPDGRPQTKRENKTDKSQWTHSPKNEVSMRKTQRPRIHIVKRGENLTQIADKYNVPLRALKGENKLPQGSKLFVGSKLLIPSAQAVQ